MEDSMYQMNNAEEYEMDGKGLQLMDLPNEILVGIISFVNLWDVPSVASSCKDLNLICQTDLLWKKLFAKRWMTPQTQHVEALRREHSAENVKTSWRTYYIHRSVQWKLWTPQFNSSPSSGLYYLYTEGKLRRNPGSEKEDLDNVADGFFWLQYIVKEDIADYLIDEEKSYGLHKNELAHFVTDPNVIKMGVTAAVFARIGLEKMTLEQAMRKTFTHLRSPKSGRRTGELLRQFSIAFMESNQDNGIFHSFEEAYTLTYAILVLDTDLHTPQVIHKMKLDTFVSLTGQTVSSRVSNEYLKEIYNNIKKNPLSIEEQKDLEEPKYKGALQTLASYFGLGKSK